MEKYESIWDGVLEFLEDSSVASTGRTCRMLYFIARDELKRRARHYLRSNNTWDHGFYPVQGYYGRRVDGDGTELDGVWWVKCACEHHKRLYAGQSCSCGVCLLKTLGSTWSGLVFVDGVRYWRPNMNSRVECSNNPTIGEGRLKVEAWELKGKVDESTPHPPPRA